MSLMTLIRNARALRSDPPRAASASTPACAVLPPPLAAMPAYSRPASMPATVPVSTRPSAPPPAASSGPASFAQLQAEFGDDPAFVVDCLKEGRTLNEALRAYSGKQMAEQARLRGPAPAAAGGLTAGLTGDEYEREVKRVMAADKIAYPLAITKVNKEKPELRIAYIERNRWCGGETHATTRSTGRHAGAMAGAAVAGDEYEREVNRVMVSDKLTYPQAVSKVNKERPELRVAYIENNRRNAGRV